MFDINIASVPDRHEVVAEVWSNNDLVAEVRRVGGRFLVQLHAPHDGSYWDFDLQELVQALHDARERLRGVEE